MAKKKENMDTLQNVEGLTKEQKKMIPIYLEKYRAIGLSTEPCNRANAEKALRACQKYLNLPDPEIIWVDSPSQGALLAAQTLKGSDDVTEEEIRDQYTKASYGSFEAYWVSFYTFIAEQFPVKKDNLIDIINDIIKDTGVYWTFDKRIIVSEKPVAIHLKDGNLHNEDGLALEYKDGTGIFAINGTRYKSLMDLELSKSLGDAVQNLA